jgi:hypothetical protein
VGRDRPRIDVDLESQTRKRVEIERLFVGNLLPGHKQFGSLSVVAVNPDAQDVSQESIFDKATEAPQTPHFSANDQSHVNRSLAAGIVAVHPLYDSNLI